MPHFAKLDENNIVTYVTVGREEDEGLELELSLRTGDTYKQTSYNTYGGIHYSQEYDENGIRLPSPDQSKSFRKNYASIGFTYSEELDAFIPPKPFDSWILDQESCLWNPPLEYPEDGKFYEWDEESVSWVASQ